MSSLSLRFFLSFSLLMASCLLSLAQGKEHWSYEPVTFPDGETEELYVYYDAFNEWLYFENEKGEVRYFLAEDLVSFRYMGSRYYSLPFKSGSYTFFKVEFEGEKIALLSKANSINLMQYMAKRYDKIYTLCDRNMGKNGVRLCRINYTVNGFTPSTFVVRHLLEKTLEPVYIKECLFVVGEKGIEIFQAKLEKEVFLGLFTKGKNFDFETLEDFFGRENYQKLQSYARENRLKEHQLEDLKVLFRYYDSM